jgi:long-chain acyl-CoA synthetase
MLVEPLLAHAKNSPGEIAIRDDAGVHTYQQLAAAAQSFAAHLATQTDQPRVAIMLPPGIGFVSSFYGTLLAGKSVVLVNFLLGDREIAHVLKDSGIDAVITIPPLAARLAGTNLKIIDITNLPPTNPPKIDPPKKSPDDMAVLIYTSGTSGLPKGVPLTYGNLQSDVDASIEHARLNSNLVFLGVIPLFHAFGMTAMMIAPIQLGATVIYLTRFSAVATVNAIREYKVSLAFAVPSMLAAIAHMKSATAEDFKSIYTLMSGGEPLPSAIRETFLNRFGLNIFEGFGLSETSPVIALNVPHAHRPGSVGQPIAGATFKIVDDNAKPLPPNEIGEIWVKGPMVAKGYFNLPNETAAAFTPDGFFKTGDLGKLDTDGYLYITGRKKELIIVAGEKASPREIEEILTKHPAVAEAAVVGKKDPGRGEVVVAFLIFKENQQAKPEELRDFCRQQELPQWKIPREIFIEKDLPRSPTGKVLKRVLTDRANQTN